MFNFINFFCLFLLLSNLSAIAWGNDPYKILSSVDNYRGYPHAFSMHINVIDKLHDQQRSQLKFHAFIKDKRASFVKYTFPVLDKEKVLLMVDDNIWFYHKKIRKPLRLSSRQRLLGNVSNADIARVNFEFDYLPVLKGTEQLGKEDCFVLELHAKHDKANYGKITLYVNKKNSKPVKGLFFAPSGRLLKIGHYQKFAFFNNMEKLTQLVIVDAIQTNKKTTVIYSQYKEEQLPNRYYNPNYLPRLIK